MNKSNFLILSGFALIAAGIVLLSSEDIGIQLAKKIIPVCFGLAGIFTFAFANANKEHKIAKQFHMIESFGFLTFSVLIAIVPKSLEAFLGLTSYFIIVFGLFEIIFIFSILNLKSKLKKSIVFFRLLTGVINLIGGFALVISLNQDAKQASVIAGILILLGGFGLFLFAQKTKTH